LSYTYIVVSHSFRFLESYNNTKSGTAIRHGEKLQTELRETIRHGEQLQRNCEKQFAMAKSSKQNCKKQFAMANSLKQNCEKEFAMANSHYKNWNDNSPWRTAITKNETPLRARRMFAQRGA